jgi:hypothetical protein
MIHDHPAKFHGAIQQVKGDTHVFRHRPGIRGIILRIVQTHGNAHAGEAGALHEMGCHGGVYAATHGDQCFFLGHCDASFYLMATFYHKAVMVAIHFFVVILGLLPVGTKIYHLFCQNIRKLPKIEKKWRN